MLMIKFGQGQHMTFCSTELQLIPLSCLKHHRKPFQKKKKSHKLLQQFRPSLIFALLFCWFFFFPP